MLEGYKLSPQQRVLWSLLRQSDKDYRAEGVFRISGVNDKEHIRASLERIVARHEILRTVFVSLPGMQLPLQVIGDVNVLWHSDEKPLTSVNRSEMVRGFIDAAGDSVPPWSSGPLVHAAIYALTDDQHLLLLSTSSLCADQESLMILAAELRAELNATNGSSEQSEPVQYPDFAAWVNDIAESSEARAARQIFLDHSSCLLHRVQLPCERFVSAADRFKPEAIQFQIPISKIKALSESSHSSIEAVLLASYKRVLDSSGTSADLIIGVYCDGRKNDQIRGVMGPVGRFVPVTINRSDSTLRQVLTNITTELGQVKDLQDCYVRDETCQCHEYGEAPLFFRYCFEFTESNNEITTDDDGISVSVLSVKACVDRFALKLSCNVNPESISVTLNYDARSFTGRYVEWLGERFRTVLEAGVEQADRKLDELRAVGRSEQQWQMQQAVGPVRQSGGGTLVELFEEAAARVPGSVAVRSGGRELSYRELEQRANRLAARLRARRVGPEVRVGVSLKRSVELVVALLGVLKAGGAYVALEAEAGWERQQWIVKDAGVELVITEESERTKWESAGVTALSVAAECEESGGERREGASAEAENLAYVIYTSGSTGRPKGVAVTHGGVVNYLRWCAAEYEVEAGAVLHSPLTFDLTVTSLWGPLVSGGVVEIVGTGVEELAAAVRKGEGRVLKLTPAHLVGLQELVTKEERAGQRRVVVIGGEALTGAVVKGWGRGAGERLINEYGPTETVVGSCVYEVQAGDEEEERIPIGRPIANTEAYVLDEGMELAPVGVTGELYLGGAGVARGYLRRAELTAASFVPHPFSEAEGARLYRTGDVVRYRVDGELEYVGRVDEQVKIRGYRIEPGEVEVVLGEHERVRAAAVVVSEQGGVGKRLEAYVEAEAGQEISVAELGAYLGERLPAYMVPGRIEVLRSLPLTENGKVDRRRLREQGGGEAARRSRYRGPESEAEEQLARIWGEVLKLEQVGIDDNFFELGGDSINAIQVRSKATSVGISFTLQELLGNPTIRVLARLATEISDDAQPGASKPFSLIEETDRRRLPADVEDAYPLSMLQAGMLFHAEYDPEKLLYQNAIGWSVRSVVDVHRLERAFERLAERHAALRTSFDFFNFSEPLQLVRREVKFPLAIHDVRHISEVDLAPLSERIKKERELAFDWAQPPLMRCCLYLREQDAFDFLLMFHHAAIDGWSLGILMAELLEEYHHAKNDPSLPQIVSIARFIELEREALLSNTTREYWTSKLNDAEFSSSLPSWARTPQQSQENSPQTREVVIPAETVRRLKAVAADCGTPLKSVLLAAHIKALSHITGNPDVVTGLVVNGRPEENGGDRLVGLFLNTVPLRLKVTGGSWADLCVQAFREEQELTPFRRYPLAEIKRQMDQREVFETAFNFVRSRSLKETIQGNGFAVLEETDFQRTNFALGVDFIQGPTPDSLKLLLHANAGISPQFINLACQYYDRVISDLAHDSTVSHSSFSPVSAPEKASLIALSQGTVQSYETHLKLHELFEAEAQRNPNAVALELFDEEITYIELDRRASRLSHQLRKNSVGPDVVVGIFMKRSVDTFTAILGVLKAGGAYVVLDPGMPAERLRFIIGDAQIRLVITHEQSAVLLPLSDEITTVFIDKEPVAPEEYEHSEPQVDIDQNNLAYIVYTSGSTGVPKGVMISHAAITGRTLELIGTYGLTSSDRVLQFLPLAFDAAAEEIFPTLSIGATLVLHPAPEEIAPDDFLSVCSELRLSVAHLYAGYWQKVVEQFAPNRPGVPGAIRILITGGESISSDQVKQWSANAEPPMRIFHVYGPTEATITATVYEWLHPQEVIGQVPIGRPLDNTEAYVLDERMEPVPKGVVGEIYLGGRGLARGYHGRADLTAERFVPHPFSTQIGARLYRSGDLGRYSSGGDLEFMGRIDAQVKVRGYRIELGEIEWVLQEHEQVAGAAVVVREGVSGKQIIGYVEVKGEREVGGEELREYLKAKLPEYMVPSTIVRVEKLPLTASGKLDRSALPEPESVRPPERYVPPRTAVEEMLAGIWQDVLRVPRVGVEDNFFELGGHSLLATQIISRVRRSFNLELPLRTLFEGPTVGELAQEVNQAWQSSRARGPSVIVRAKREQHLPLSFAQQRLWFLHQMEPDNHHYNVPIVLRLTGNLDATALQRSLNQLVDRHESLRTSFPVIDGQPVQLIHNSAEVPLAQIDLRHLSEPDLSRQITELSEEDARHRFDLARVPLLKAKLLYLRTDEHLLLLTMHHIITDGWSIMVLMREMSHLYEAARLSVPPALPELAIQYADYASWQREWLTGDVLQQHLEYWTRQLEGAPPVLELPTDHPRPAVQSYRGARCNATLSFEVSEAIRKLSGRESVTLFMTLAAVFKVLLYKYTGKADIVIGTPVANRNHRELEDLIGFFVNIVVLRTDLSGNPSFRELLARVREVTLSAYANQELPFERLVESLQIRRDLSHSPIFQVLFVLQTSSLNPVDVESLAVELVNTSKHTALYDWTISISDTDPIQVALEYNSDIWNSSTADQVLRYYINLLEQFAADPDRDVEGSALLSADERSELLMNSRGAYLEADYSSNSVQSLFEMQVQRSDDKLVIISGQRQMSYTELNGEANRLARYLRTHGIGPESVVCIYMPKGFDLLIAIFGVLKSGGAFLCIESGLPNARVDFMLRDSGAQLILTEKVMADRLPNTSAVVCMEDCKGLIGDWPADDIEIRSEPLNLAYLIYTSGSTGIPKATSITHDSFFNYVLSAKRAYGLQPTDRVLQFSSLSFDVSIEEIFLTLTCGGTLVLPAASAIDAHGLLSSCQEAGVTVIDLPTSYWHELMVQVADGSLRLPDSLRLVVFGGEAASPQDVATFQRHCPGIRLLNAYGPTEATIEATVFEIDGQSTFPDKVPIGRPLDNTEAYVLDERMEPVPKGVVGEIYLGGRGLARGYHGRADLTAERFVPHPFSTQVGARLYRTGDLGRYSSAGELEFSGRLDDQVKVRGYRIELGEIEWVLQEHEQVAGAAVVVREGAGGKQIVGYVEVKGEREVGSEELREYLKAKLPEYMVPSTIVRVEKLPLTASGKLDRNALPEPESTSTQPSIESDIAVENTIAAIWRRLLDRDVVGFNDNFFEMGGHSLLLIRLHHELTMAVGQLSVLDLFQHPTIASQAQLLTRSESRTPARSPGRAPRVSVRLKQTEQRNTLLSRRTNLTATAQVPRDQNKDEQAVDQFVRQLSRVARCTSPSFSPDGNEVAFISDMNGTPQLWIVSTMGGWPRLVTDFDDPVVSAFWSPKQDLIAGVVASRGGGSQQVFLVRSDGTNLQSVTDGGAQTNLLKGWDREGRHLLLGSDRMGSAVLDPYLFDVESRRMELLAPSLAIACAADTSSDGKTVLVFQMMQRGVEGLQLVNRDEGKSRWLVPCDSPATCRGAMTRDGRTVYCCTDKGQDRTGFARIAITGDGSDESLKYLMNRDDAELNSFGLNHLETEAALVWNVDGRSELDLIDLNTLEHRRINPLPDEVIDDVAYSSDDKWILVSASGPRAPSNVWMLDLFNNSWRPLTHTQSPGIELSALIKPQLVRFNADDGLPLSGWLYTKPENKSPGPVVINFHGGPESQEIPSFRSDYQALLASGINVFAPNIRGSSGYGRAFAALDNGPLRANAIRDVQRCAMYLIESGIAAEGRIGIMGASYGGFLVMAGLTEFPDLFAAGVNLSGIVNFETFFQNTESWMAQISRFEYGDPVHQKELLHSLSPINKIDRVRNPVLVIHGANDTNVPVEEAQQIVAALDNRGVEVQLLLFEDEGHGIRKQVNSVKATTVIVKWFMRHL